MESIKFFQAATNSAAIDYFAYGLIGLLLILALLLFLGTRGKDTRIYDAKMAWLRAWIYFSICWLLSWSTGVLSTLLETPLVDPAHVAETGWKVYVTVTWAIILFGYLYIWPKGTVTYNRKLYLLPTVLIGVVWGLSEAQLFLAFWSIAEYFIDTTWMIAIAVYAMATIANSLLHIFWWDRYVSPDHNIYEWNMKKVGLAHNPNLILSLIYLVIWGDLWIYLMWPAFALFACAIAQKFPAPWDTLAHGELEAQQGLCDVATLSLPAEKRDPK